MEYSFLVYYVSTAGYERVTQLATSGGVPTLAEALKAFSLLMVSMKHFDDEDAAAASAYRIERVVAGQKTAYSS